MSKASREDWIEVHLAIRDTVKGRPPVGLSREALLRVADAIAADPELYALVPELARQSHDAYEALCGVWHSKKCYESVAYNGSGCTCGLKLANDILRDMATAARALPAKTESDHG